MIKLKITKSDNQNQIGDFEFGKNQLLFSKTKKSDILSPTSFAIEIVKGELFLINPHNNIFVNNKYSGELSKIKNNDTLGLKNFEVKILEFEPTDFPTMKEVLNQNTEFIIKNRPELLKEITELRNELKNA